MGRLERIYSVLYVWKHFRSRKAGSWKSFRTRTLENPIHTLGIAAATSALGRRRSGLGILVSVVREHKWDNFRYRGRRLRPCSRRISGKRSPGGLCGQSHFRSRYSRPRPSFLTERSLPFPRKREQNDQVPGGGDVQGRGRGLHGGGAGAAGLRPEEAVPRCDAGELQEPGLSGESALQTRPYIPAGERTKGFDDGDRNPERWVFRNQEST
ncbi:zinc finger protein 112 isoform 4-T6 [Hipposideros larvatus]